MWGNLRHSLANAAGESIQNIQSPGKLIAKVAEVVAPPLSDDEYETGSGEDGEYEEYEEYYEEEEEGEYDEDTMLQSEEEEAIDFTTNLENDGESRGNEEGEEEVGLNISGVSNSSMGESFGEAWKKSSNLTVVSDINGEIDNEDINQDDNTEEDANLELASEPIQASSGEDDNGMASPQSSLSNRNTVTKTTPEWSVESVQRLKQQDREIYLQQQSTEVSSEMERTKAFPSVDPEVYTEMNIPSTTPSFPSTGITGTLSSSVMIESDSCSDMFSNRSTVGDDDIIRDQIIIEEFINNDNRERSSEYEDEIVKNENPLIEDKEEEVIDSIVSEKGIEEHIDNNDTSSFSMKSMNMEQEKIDDASGVECENETTANNDMLSTSPAEISQPTSNATELNKDELPSVVDNNERRDLNIASTVTEVATTTNGAASSDIPSDETKALDLETKRLQSELVSAKDVIAQLQKEIAQKDLEQMKVKELQSEAHQIQSNEIDQLQETFMDRIQKLEQQLFQQENEASQDRERYQRLLEEAKNREVDAENERKNELLKQNAKMAETQKRHAAALERVEVKASRAMMALDEKNSEVKQLQVVINEMRSAIKENVEAAEGAEEEADELHDENEKLQLKLKEMEKDRNRLKKELKEIHGDHDKLMGVQMELTMLKEEREREREKLVTETENHSTNQAKINAERDAAKAEALDLEHRLAALTADLDIVKSDYSRSVTANSNLQRALEAFQIERDAELALLEESRISSEEAIKAAHEASLQAAKEANETLMKEVQMAANKAVTNMMNELSSTEQKLDDYRKENVNLRRSLDEAILRLQKNEEDVIDRSLMKNILLDWHSRSGRSKREVLMIMSRVLHFTEEDKDKCGIGENSGNIGKAVVGAVAPPLTPARKNYDELSGDTVREKWVSFLLSECGEDGTEDSDSRKNEKSKVGRGRSTESTTI